MTHSDINALFADFPPADEMAERRLRQFFKSHFRGDNRAPPPKRRHRQPALRPPDGLLTASEAAAKLGCSIKTLNGHVAAGVLKYVIIGHGMKRPRKVFTAADLNAFIEAQTRKAVPCPLSVSHARRTGISISKCEVIDFGGPRKPPIGVKHKK